MPGILARYATPLTTGLFLVSLISGVALFFHLGSAWFHGMHEWLSMVLIAPFVLHLWKNWRPFVSYFKRPPMAIALAASLAASVAFVVPLLGGEAPAGNPMVALAGAVQKSSVATVAPVFGKTPETLTAVLEQNGYRVASPNDSLAAVAAASGKSGRDIVVLLATMD
ncbi:DUF4405 domain-containing protein [Polymorphum gilvum]|uniref:Membrane protein, putative n=1 Tax=Polymorphum gilvum (strain LMG 25793 / CGMCC 1.9160 / SL003B-26A1) TaxID=991905 RepID=F2J5X4_POLGS|nr:DUF4405 domain-containing protein [Polymorphum gilvum]ADZ71228.1 Membrane protein, putative [Polymorphum gilvum SL003B-26A1]